MCLYIYVQARIMYFPKNVQTDCRATQPPIQWVPMAITLVIKWLGPGPYLGILRPWAQENFAAPPNKQ